MKSGISERSPNIGRHSGRYIISKTVRTCSVIQDVAHTTTFVVNCAQKDLSKFKRTPVFPDSASALTGVAAAHTSPKPEFNHRIIYNDLRSLCGACLEVHTTNRLDCAGERIVKAITPSRFKSADHPGIQSTLSFSRGYLEYSGKEIPPSFFHYIAECRRI